MAKRPPKPLGLTRAEVADELGVTVKTVGYIERTALLKLRAWCSRHGITRAEFSREAFSSAVPDDLPEDPDMPDIDQDQ